MSSELVRIEIIAAQNKSTAVINCLEKLGVGGITTFQALGSGIQKGTFEYEPEENKEIRLLPKVLLLVICEKKQVKAIVDAVKVELYTGHIGDGKILISGIDNVIRIRTGEEGKAAIERSALS